MGVIVKSAAAGTMDSSDAFVEIFPAEELSLEISSVVMERFGEAIEKAVREQLAECGVEKALVRVTDRGALVCAVGAGVGFMLAMVMFSGVRKRVEACDPPAPFKGLPITLIAAAITSLSFMGFGGLVENLFNVTL